MTLEKDLEKRCVRETEVKGGMLIKLLPFSLSGLPDRLCILPGRPMFFVELKRQGGKASKLQLWLHKKLLNLGQAVYVCDNFEAFRVILLKHFNLPAYDFRATD